MHIKVHCTKYYNDAHNLHITVNTCGQVMSAWYAITIMPLLKIGPAAAADVERCEWLLDITDTNIWSRS